MKAIYCGGGGSRVSWLPLCPLKWVATLEWAANLLQAYKLGIFEPEHKQQWNPLTTGVRAAMRAADIWDT
jgi:hypothetical protein